MQFYRIRHMMIDDSTAKNNRLLDREFIPKTEHLDIQESPADAVKPARRKSMQKLQQFDVFRFISPNSISLNFKV